MLRTIVTFLLLFGNVLANAAEFCVANDTQLTMAFSTASKNTEDDTVKVVQGIYAGSFKYESTEQFSLSIEGGYTPNCESRVVSRTTTIFDGSSTNEMIFTLSTSQPITFQIDRLTIQNSKAENLNLGIGPQGGGLRIITKGNVTISDTLVQGNSYRFGGGVEITGDEAFSTIIITNSIVRNNTALVGGGILVRDVNILELRRNYILDNVAGFDDSSGSNGGGGGGLAMVSGISNVALDENIFEGNISVRSVGGGGFATILRSVKSLVVTNNVLSNNSAQYGGGGALAMAHNMRIANNIVYSNNDRSEGGGLSLFALDEISLVNNTIVNNKADLRGGGLVVKLAKGSVVNVYNNIISNNIADAGADVFFYDDLNGDQLPDGTINLSYNGFDVSNAGLNSQTSILAGTSNINVVSSPFIGLSALKLRLNSGSPLVNSGLNTAPGILSTSKDGLPRIIGGTVDLGAYEVINNESAIANDTSYIALSSVELKKISAHTVTISNAGGNDLVVGNITTAGRSSGRLSVSQDGCSGVSLAVLQSCEFDVQFTSDSLGLFEEEILIPSSDSTNPQTIIFALAEAVPETSMSGGSGRGSGGSIGLSALLLSFIITLFRLAHARKL